MGEKIGSKVVKNFEKNEKNKKITQNKALKGTLKIGKAGVHVVASVYEGLYGAMIIVGQGLSETTTDIVEHKYGKDVAEVTKHSNIFIFVLI